MDRTIITSDKAPKAIGPYSVAVRTGDLIYSAGQVGIDPASGELVPGGVEAEARQALTNLGQVLVDAGSGLDRVLKTTVFLTDMADFAAVNAVYAEFFLKDPPARSTVAAAGLPRGARFEVEAVAVAR
jgi:2-iminobutanoate/2-iminopropanoate deaminase